MKRLAYAILYGVVGFAGSSLAWLTHSWISGRAFTWSQLTTAVLFGVMLALWCLIFGTQTRVQRRHRERER